MKINFLYGMTWESWMTLLKDNHFAVNPRYWHRTSLITFTSILNSVYRKRESYIYDDRIAATEIKKSPIFILGHWRSGTTYLQRLLLVNQRYASPNLYQVTNPETFLYSERVVSKFLAFSLSKKRLHDNMEQKFDSSGEDEIALGILTGLSPYTVLSFPQQVNHYNKYLTFQGVSTEEIEIWKTKFLFFLKKLTLNYSRRLILKSPPHTCRIRLLLEMFPNSKFVHIHRNPYEVFQSTRHLMDFWREHYCLLQQFKFDDIEDDIIRRYNEMYNAYFEELGLIPKGRFCEIRFEDLEQDPIDQIQYIYKNLNLNGYKDIESKLHAYIHSLSDYKKNKHKSIDNTLRSKITKAWERNFTIWNYEV